MFEDIKRCTRCALCVQNCPIYDIKKDENNTARGLICKLSGYLDNKLSEKEIKKDFKICLNCSKCKTNCPSKIDTSYIFACKNAYLSPTKVSQRLFLFLKLLPLKLLYFINLLKPKVKKAKNSDILYFKGCVARAQHKNTFLDELFYDPGFCCCGLPYLSGGDIKNYEKAKQKNLELMKNAHTVVFDCASCKSAVSEYYQGSAKLVFFDELLKDIKIKTKYKTITLHKPCHMDKADFERIEKLLSSIEGVNYIRLENFDTCCGFGGSYFLFHPVVALKIALKKAKTIKNSEADLILTSCPSCTLGLRFTQLITFSFKKTLELRDFINNYK